MLEIDVKILDDRIREWGFPHYGSNASAGLDLHACIGEPLVLLPGREALLIDSGIAVLIGDPDWVGILSPRSGAGHRGLVLGNTIGVIDADYTGPVKVSAWNRSHSEIIINPGERIAQMLFVRVTRPQFRFVDDLTNTERGQGGFGSTGA